MTTGRINQVTTFRPHSILTTLSLLLSRSGVRQKVDHNLFRGLAKTHSQLSARLHFTRLSAESTNQFHLVPPGPTFFRLSSSCQLMLTKITTFRENCSQLALKSVTADSQLSNISAFPLATSPHSPFCPLQTKCSFGLTCYNWVSSTQATVLPNPVQAF